jgi:hypothetical protein
VLGLSRAPALLPTGQWEGFKALPTVVPPVKQVRLGAGNARGPVMRQSQWTLGGRKGVYSNTADF